MNNKWSEDENKILLEYCSKKIKCPYYFGVNKNDMKEKEAYIRLYDSKIAMMVQLYGDIHSYLESVKARK